MTVRKSFAVVALLGFALWTSSAGAAGLTDGMKKGDPALKSAGQLAFGPEGILFIGDEKAATIFAIATGDVGPATVGHPSISVPGLKSKIAAMVGASADEVRILDLAVNPASHTSYLSVARGRGADALPVMFTVDEHGKLAEFSLQGVSYSSAAIPNPVASPASGRSSRGESITDLAYVDGRVFVAGLSNEEFASNLRSIDFPFSEFGGGTSVEIYHGAHGRWETRSPVRTFVPYEVKQQSYLLAAYTCTPLVKFPIDQLTPDSKIVGTTIAELGNRNRPLDMIVYTKGGKDYILLNNSSRGVMKIPADPAADQEGITERVGGGGTAGIGFETIADLQGVVQLDQLDSGHAVIIVQADSGDQDLKSIHLP